MSRDRRNAWLVAYYRFAAVDLVPLVHFSGKAIRSGNRGPDRMVFWLIAIGSILAHTAIFIPLGASFERDIRGWPYYSLFFILVTLILGMVLTGFLSTDWDWD